MVCVHKCGIHTVQEPAVNAVADAQHVAGCAAGRRLLLRFLRSGVLAARHQVAQRLHNVTLSSLVFSCHRKRWLHPAD